VQDNVTDGTTLSLPTDVDTTSNADLLARTSGVMQEIVISKVDTPPPTPTALLPESEIDSLKCHSKSLECRQQFLSNCSVSEGEQCSATGQLHHVHSEKSPLAAPDNGCNNRDIVVSLGTSHCSQSTPECTNVRVKSEDCSIATNVKSSPHQKDHQRNSESEPPRSMAGDIRCQAGGSCTDGGLTTRGREVVKSEAPAQRHDKHTDDSNKRSYLQAFKNSLHFDQQQGPDMTGVSDRRGAAVECEMSGTSKSHNALQHRDAGVISSAASLSQSQTNGALISSEAEITRDLVYRRQMELLRLQQAGGPGDDFARLAAAAAAYGYGIDPALQAHLMAATNPEYRMHYERWISEQQRYHQQISGIEATGSKPVDMSSKGIFTQRSTDRPISPFPRPRGGNHSSGLKHDETRSFAHDSLMHQSSPQLSPRDKNIKDSGRDRTSDSRREAARRPNDFGERIPSLGQQTTGKGQKWSETGSSPVRSKAKTPNLISSSVSTTGGGYPSSVFPAPLPPSKIGSRAQVDIGGYPPPAILGGFHGSAPPFFEPPVSGNFLQDMDSGQQGLQYKDRTLSDAISRRTSNDAVRPKSRQPSPLLPGGDIKTTSPATWKDKQQAADNNIDKLAPPGGVDGPTWSSDKLASTTASSPSSHGSPLTLRHLHTHHHTHVVQGPGGYPLYGLISPVPSIVPPVPPPLSVPQPYIPK
jgi:hypothetical protein